MEGIRVLTISGRDAVSRLDDLRRDYARTGLYPVLFGNRDELALIEEGYGANESDTPQAIIAESWEIDIQQWMKDRIEQDPEYYQLIHGPWPTDPFPPAEIMTLRDHNGILKDPVFVGLVPVQQPWETFAWLRWGGWNDCPLPAVQCAMHRHWQEQFSTEVVSITGDVTESKVGRPPQDREAALSLASEQFYYCGDLVRQGLGSIEALAASLIGAPYWYFWWD